MLNSRTWLKIRTSTLSLDYKLWWMQIAELVICLLSLIIVLGTANGACYVKGTGSFYIDLEPNFLQVHLRSTMC